MALARMDYHVALTTIANFTCHMNLEESVAKPLFHFMREPVKCRLQLRPHTWTINAIHETLTLHSVLPVTLSVNTRNVSKTRRRREVVSSYSGKNETKLAQANPHRMSGGAKLSGNVCDLPLERATRDAIC